MADPVTTSTTTTTQAPASTAAAVTPPAATPSSWDSGFNPDLKGYVETKGFKDAAQLAESYRNFEKLQGVPQDRILKLADKMRDDQGVLTKEGRQIFERLGTPSDPKDYQIEVPKEGGDPQMAEVFRKMFFDEGITKPQAERLVKGWNELQGKAAGLQKEAAEANFKNADQALRKEWGSAYDQNVNIAKEAVRTIGLDDKGINALSSQIGHDKTMKLLQKMGSAVGEGRFVQGGSANQINTPDAAKSQITALMKDRDFASRLSRGDAEAVAKWTRLNMEAAPGEMNIGSR